MNLPKPLVQWLRELGEGLPYELMQLLTDMSCLFVTVDTTRADESLNNQACQSLLDECLDLERWFQKFLTNVSACGTNEDPPIYNRGEIKTGLPATYDLFGPAYQFTSVGEANLHIYTWTSLSSIYPLIHQAHALAEPTSTNNVPKFLLDDHSPQHAAHHLSALYISKALRCIPYCLQEGMNSWPSF
jgi:hypothetical protein